MYLQNTKTLLYYIYYDRNKTSSDIKWNIGKK